MAIDSATLESLRTRALEVRKELLTVFSVGKTHHFGGCLSVVDIMVALFFYRMNYDAGNWRDPERDRFIMSKGHAVPVQYVILGMLGIVDREEVKTIKRLGSPFQGHPDMRKTPGIEAPTGSLGQGLSFANGTALACRHDAIANSIFLVVGDGELQEGQFWEAAMTTAQYGLKNVCVIVDRNCFQSQGCVDEMMNVEPIDKKLESFGWNAERVDGNDIEQMCTALDKTRDRDSGPFAIVADTIKGKGVSFLENTYKYHNYKLSKEEFDRAMEELGASR